MAWQPRGGGGVVSGEERQGEQRGGGGGEGEEQRPRVRGGGRAEQRHDAMDARASKHGCLRGVYLALARVCVSVCE